jgi:hypothetical protein
VLPWSTAVLAESDKSRWFGGVRPRGLDGLVEWKESTRVMTRSPDSLIPSEVEQLASEKRDDKAFKCRQEGKANLRAATQVNAVSAS